MRAGQRPGDKCSYDDLQDCEPKLKETCIHACMVHGMDGVSQEPGRGR